MTPVKKKQEASNQPAISSTDISGIIQDIQAISGVLETHDKAIFQAIIGINILQKILIDKNIITEEEISEIAKIETEKTKQFIQNVMKAS